MKSVKLVLVSAIILAQSIFMMGQGQPNLSNGIPPQGSYDSSSVDTVNLMNGNLTLHIPLPVDYPQRGKLGIKYYMVLNSKTWKAYDTPSPGQWQPTSICQTGSTPPFSTGPCGQDSLFVSTASFSMTRVWQKVWPDGQFPSYSAGTPDTLVTWDGAVHPIGGDSSGYTIQVSGDDGTGVYTTATIIDRNGTQYSGQFPTGGIGECTTDPGNGLPGSTQTTTCIQQWSLSSVTDVNGNVLNPPIAIPGIGPQGGTMIAAHLAAGSESAGCTSVAGPIWVSYFNYPAPNGQTNQIKLCFATYPQLATSFSQAGVHQFQDAYSGHPFPGPWRQPVYLSNVILPDNTQWAISYDSYGEVTSLSTPTGATIQYGWGEGTFPACNVAGNDITKVSRAVQSRTMTDVNGHVFTSNYQWSPQAGDGTLSHTMTDPSGNDAVHTFVDLTATWITPSCDFRETRTVSYQGSGGSRTPLKQVDTTWLNSRFGGAYGVPSDVKTTLFPSQKVSLVHTDYAPSLPFLNLVTSQKTYDWGQGAPGALLREQDTVYQWQKDSRYLTANMLDLPASTIVVSPIAANNIKSSCPVDGAGTLKACMAETDSIYDEPAYLTNYEGTVGALPAGSHVAAPNPVRGNPTTVSKWLNTGGSVASHTNWYDTGEVYQSTDPGGHTTTYSYDLAYKGMLPTKICNARNQCSSSTYDVNTGLLTSSTDVNAGYPAIGTTPGDPAHTTSFSYDALKRLTSNVQPADLNGNQPTSTFAYPEVSTIEQLKAITTSMNDSLTTHFDGFGHATRTEHVTPSGTILADVAYDGMDHVISTTNPYLTTGDATYGVSQTVYDGAGRATSATEQDNSIRTVDYSGGNCIVATDEAGKQRRSCTDALRRLIEVDEPGIGTAGTPASGSLNVSGSLRNLSGSTPTPGTGSVALTGSEQSKAATPAKPASGSVTITGSDQSVTSGGDRYCAVYNENGDCVDWEFNPPTTTYDWGTVSITVNGFTKSVSYDQSSTQSSIPAALASAFNADTTSPVTASVTSNTVMLTAKVAGTGGNSYALSVTSSTGDPTDFSAASFGGSASGATLSGGANAGPTIYDSGACSITIAGTLYSTSFGQWDTPNTIAARLSGIVNSGSLVSDTASGTTESLIAKIGGTASNYTLAATCTHDSANFSTGSFAASTSGSSLAGGTNAGPPSVDSGTVTLSIGSTTSVTACYGPSGSCAPVSGCATGASTASQVACVLGQGLSVSGSPVTPTVSGSSISMVFKNVGLAGNVAVNVVSSPAQPGVFPGGSFSGSATLSGGADPVPPSLQNPYVTLYSYDALGNLLRVDQQGTAPSDSTKWRTRLSTYDSLSRLLTAYNPESGTVSYSYDADGNVLQKTSPAANQTGSATQTISYCYDQLHRLTGIAYLAQACPLTSPVISYTYDAGANAIGHLSSMTDQAGTATYSYDAPGRLISEQRTIAGVTKAISYDYNLDDSIKAVHYPSGRVVNYTYNSARQPLTATDANGTQYVSNATFYPNGTEYQRWMPNIYFRTDLNKRLQTAGYYSDNGQVTSYYMSKTYFYNDGHNNRDVLSIINNKDTNRTQIYTYDALNRLTSGSSQSSTGPTSWGENYTIDAWGNLQISPMAGKAHGGNFQCAGDANNRANCLVYDAAGNLSAYQFAQYTYDPENRLQGTAGFTYTYDGDGQRVLKSQGGTPSKRYWSMFGHTLAEGDGAGNISSEYVFFDGDLVARIDLANNSAHYYLSDHLKSTSIVVTAAGTIEEESDYSGFGTEFSLTSGANRYKFEGNETDTESQLDYFGPRYYASMLGRFTSADWSEKPVPVPYAEFRDPQSLNLYSISRNRPTVMRDDGHEDIAGGDHPTVTTNPDGSKTSTETVKTTEITKPVSLGNGNWQTQVITTTTTYSATFDAYNNLMPGTATQEQNFTVQNFVNGQAQGPAENVPGPGKQPLNPRDPEVAVLQKAAATFFNRSVGDDLNKASDVAGPAGKVMKPVGAIANFFNVTYMTLVAWGHTIAAAECNCDPRDLPPGPGITVVPDDQQQPPPKKP
ncbi:MAG TPA: RHS repeat-associated core domain-containing protein [Terriglobales bacterium]|jgi:RHS repeat-associated protein|nr:RHS repeat-associated core domain-containing protein [Terriglobales bacterium]